MTDFYMTDFGPVRVSPTEAITLKLARDIRALGWEAKFAPTIARAVLIESACERLAQSKVEAE